MKNEATPLVVEEAPLAVQASQESQESQESWINRYARVMARFVPDAITTAALMVVVLVIAALALGNSFAATMDAWYRGLWRLLPFTMQVTLVLVLGSVLGATPLFRKIIVFFSCKANSVTQVIAYSALLAAAVSYLNWGLALALGPLIAVHFASEAERKGIPVDFPFLLAAQGGAGSVWQYGLSSSGPLMMATAGHFLEKTTGVVPLSSTIWSPAALVLVIGFTIAVIVMACMLMPRRPQTIAEFPAARKLAEPLPPGTDEKEDGGINYSKRMERHSFIPWILAVALAGWLYNHFLLNRASLDLNSLNTIFLLLCLVLHGNIRNFAQALQRAVVSCWPILVLYHLYAGVAGLIEFTTIGTAFTSLFAPISTRWTYPLLTAVAGTIVALFVPSSGGQWVIQGYVTLKAAEAVGVSAQRGMLALGVGDQMGNLVAPFWFVIRAEIARIDFRTFFGYGLIFAALWFVCGVLAFTFLPC